MEGNLEEKDNRVSGETVPWPPLSWQRHALDAYLALPSEDISHIPACLRPVRSFSEFIKTVSAENGLQVEYAGHTTPRLEWFRRHDIAQSLVTTLTFRVQGREEPEDVRFRFPYPREDGLFLIEGALRYYPLHGRAENVRRRGGKRRRKDEATEPAERPLAFTLSLIPHDIEEYILHWFRERQKLTRFRQLARRGKTTRRGSLTMVEIKGPLRKPLRPFQLSATTFKTLMSAVKYRVFKLGKNLFVFPGRSTGEGEPDAPVANSIRAASIWRELRLRGLLRLGGLRELVNGVLDPVQSSERASRAGRARVVCDGVVPDVAGRRLFPPPGADGPRFGPALASVPFIEVNKPVRMFMTAKMACEADSIVGGEAPLVVTPSEHGGLWKGLGQNLLTAWLPLGGYTFEDALVVSSEAARGLVSRKWRIRQFEVPFEMRVRNVTDDKYDHGVIRKNVHVKIGDPLVLLWKYREALPCAEELRVLAGRGEYRALGWFLDQRWMHDIRSPYDGVVEDVAIHDYLAGDEGLARADQTGVQKTVEIRFLLERDFRVGDKLSNRYGNKGVVSKILGREVTPTLKGTDLTVQVLASPFGVDGRQNYGQLLEGLAGLYARLKGGPPANPWAHDWWSDLPIDAKDGLGTVVFPDGREVRCPVGVGFWFRPSNAAHDKGNVRGTGPYGRVSTQPTHGTRDGGAQRIGRMPLECLLGHNTPEILQELCIWRSDSQHFRKNGYADIRTALAEPALGDLASLVNLDRFLRAMHLRLSVTDKAGAPVSDWRTLPCSRLGGLGIDWYEPPVDARRYDIVRGSHKYVRTSEGKQRAWSVKNVLECDACAGDRDILIDLKGEYQHAFFENTIRVLPLLPASLRPAVAGLGIPHRLTQVYLRRDGEFAARRNRKNGEEKPSAPSEAAGLLERLEENPPDPRRIKAKVHEAITHATSMLLGKSGFARHFIIGKYVDFSSRFVIVPDAELGLDVCGLPADAVEALFPEQVGVPPSERYVLLNREPSLHKLNVLAFRVKSYPAGERVIRLHPAVVNPFGGDFDGDTMAVFSVLRAIKEAKRLLPSENFLHPGHGGLAFPAIKDCEAVLKQRLQDEPSFPLAFFPELKPDVWTEPMRIKKQALTEELAKADSHKAREAIEAKLRQLPRDQMMLFQTSVAARWGFATATEERVTIAEKWRLLYNDCLARAEQHMPDLFRKLTESLLLDADSVRAKSRQGMKEFAMTAGREVGTYVFLLTLGETKSIGATQIG